MHINYCNGENACKRKKFGKHRFSPRLLFLLFTPAFVPIAFLADLHVFSYFFRSFREIIYLRMTKEILIFISINLVPVVLFISLLTVNFKRHRSLNRLTIKEWIIMSFRFSYYKWHQGYILKQHQMHPSGILFAKHWSDGINEKWTIRATEFLRENEA